jgi:hypothetical protein
LVLLWWLVMAQHFLLSAAARSLSSAKIMRMSDQGVENVFLRLRWPETDGKPVCPGCGCPICYPCRRPNGQLILHDQGRSESAVPRYASTMRSSLSTWSGTSSQINAPLFSTAIRSDTCRTSRILCSMSMMVTSRSADATQQADQLDDLLFHQAAGRAYMREVLQIAANLAEMHST